MLGWDRLVIDTRTPELPLIQERFADWMAEKRIFVSSTISDMLEERQAVRGLIKRYGATAVMWEEATVTPQTQPPEQAYLDGVDTSDIFVLFLKNRYGIRDTTGYSPTNKEYNRAKDRKLEILIFRDETIEPEDKEGRLNDWIRELENFHSLADYSEIDDLTEKLLERLRGLASQELTVWAKLGNIVFQCTEMSQEIVAGSKNTRISARTRDQRILQALTQMDHQLRYLTFGNESSPVKVLNATTSRVSPNETQVQLELEETIDRDILMDPFPITVRVGNRTYTSSDRAQLWIQRYIFGKDPGLEENFGFVLSEYPVVDLKELLQASVQLPSRLLRQLARLYIVEHLLYFWAGTVRSCIVTGETPGNLNLELEWDEHPQYADEEPETHEISGNF